MEAHIPDAKALLKVIQTLNVMIREKDNNIVHLEGMIRRL